MRGLKGGGRGRRGARGVVPAHAGIKGMEMRASGAILGGTRTCGD